MQLISKAVLLEYFKGMNNRFKNRNGMELGMADGNECWTYFSLCNHSYRPLAINISTEGDCPDDFIQQFKIATINDIETLDYNNSWMRYLNGEAEIAVSPFELEAELMFKIIHRKTIIFSLELHFYDEVYEHLTIPSDFERYISEHQNRLYEAVSNRFRMNRK